MDLQKTRQMGNTQSLLSEYSKAQDFLHIDKLKELETSLEIEQRSYEDLPVSLDEPAFIHALRWAIQKLEETK